MSEQYDERKQRAAVGRARLAGLDDRQIVDVTLEQAIVRMRQLVDPAALAEALADAAARLRATLPATPAKLVTGTSGGGIVTVTTDTDGRLHAVTIDDSLMVTGGGEVVADLIKAAWEAARG